MSMLPGQPGSTRPAGEDWIAQKLRALEQANEQLRGQLSRAEARLAHAVTNVTVTGSTLTVSFGNGTSQTYTLP